MTETVTTEDVIEKALAAKAAAEEALSKALTLRGKDQAARLTLKGFLHEASADAEYAAADLRNAVEWYEPEGVIND